MRLKPREVPAELLSLAQRQAGVVSRSQARAAGVSSKTIFLRVSRRIWLLLPFSLVLDPTQPATPHQTAWALWLRAGEGSVLSGRTALELHRTRLDWLSRLPALVIVPKTRHTRIPGAVVRRGNHGTLRTVSKFGLPLRSPQDALIDVVPFMVEQHAVDALDSAMQLGLFTHVGLLNALRDRVVPGCKHAGAITRAIQSLRLEGESHLERRFAALLRAVPGHGLQAGHLLLDGSGVPV
ncbi:MAG: hypothetical protein O2819_07175, partial [Planctomycetota bacterium]|nr:hypothetical protein [Planctomycetota bacterium]